MKILVVGGTGGFGSVIARQLCDEGHRITVAGRNKKRGKAFVHANPDIDFVELERSAIKPQDLAAYDIVVDASGPFQDTLLSLPSAAIAAGIDYLDIADDRAFIRRVSRLDRKARDAGVRILSGVSSIPTLSGAVALELASDMELVESVEIAITASSKAAFGRAVLLSMLEGAGKPITRADETMGRAMASPRTIEIKRDGQATIDRIVLEVDSPDHDTLPTVLPGNPSVTFHAGSELALHNRAIQAIASLVSRGVISTGTRFLPFASIARRASAGFGDGRSAMEVRVTCQAGGKRIMRRWTVVASRNTGPMIPCLSVPAMIEAIKDDRVSSGAGPSIDILASDEILGRMPEGSISIETTETRASLYARAMPRFEQVHPAVRALHDQPMPAAAQGRASVVRGNSFLVPLIARLFGFPPASADTEVRVHFEAHGTGERWTRNFGGTTFSSVLTERTGGVSERFGPFSFHFDLKEKEGRLAMVPAGWSMLGMPMPRFLMPSGIATEYEEAGRFHFDVPIVLPIIGPIVHYRGWLEKPDMEN